ncbi:MAG TPA: 3-deoxy-manno-octulosonate cytidylyltransferase, partial [Candidatus Ozemobacteraceae bacterium]
ASGAFDRVIVATDSDRIVAAVTAAGFEARLTDPALPSGTARTAVISDDMVYDVYVNVQGDEPLVDAEGLKRLTAAFADPSVGMATLWYPLAESDHDNPNAVKVVADVREDALFFSRSLIPHPRIRDGFAPRKHIGVYGYRRETLRRLVSLPPCDPERIESLEQLRALYHGIRIRLVPASRETLGVDTPADLERVRAVFEGRAS